jgi:ribonucleoside-diphosphate reductase beta chain
MLNAVEHTNFFENRATEYSKASTTGTWEEAFANPSSNTMTADSITADPITPGPMAAIAETRAPS